jgi:hypothetical protein
MVETAKREVAESGEDRGGGGLVNDFQMRADQSNAKA